MIENWKEHKRRNTKREYLLITWHVFISALFSGSRFINWLWYTLGLVRKCLLFILKIDACYIKNQNPVEYTFSKAGINIHRDYITLSKWRFHYPVTQRVTSFRSLPTNLSGVAKQLKSMIREDLSIYSEFISCLNSSKEVTFRSSGILFPAQVIRMKPNFMQQMLK